MVSETKRVKARNDPVASRASCIRMINEHYYNLGLLLMVSLALVGVARASDLSASDADYLGDQSLKIANDDDEMTRTLDREPSNEMGDETNPRPDNKTSGFDSMYADSIKIEESNLVEVSEQPQSIGNNWLVGNSSQSQTKRGLEGERNVVSVMNNQSSSIVFDVAKRRSVNHIKESSMIDEGGHKAKISIRDVKKNNQAIESYRQASSLVDSDKEFDNFDYPTPTTIPTKEPRDKSTRRNDPKTQSSTGNVIAKNNSSMASRKSTTPSTTDKPTTSVFAVDRSSIPDGINKRQQKNTELKALESSTMESKIVVTNSPNVSSEDSASDEDDQTTNSDAGSKAEGETQGQEEPSSASRSNETHSAPVRSASVATKGKTTAKEAARNSLGQEQQAARVPPDGRQLLVGPFKTESEAPDTITLAGVVYEKSGLSSPIQASSLTSTFQPQVMGSSNIETAIVNGKFGHKFIQIPADKSKLDLTSLIAASHHHHRYPAWSQLAANHIYVPLSQAQLMNLLSKGQQRQQVGGHMDQHRALKSGHLYNQPNVSLTLTSIPSSISLLAHLTDIISSLDTKQVASSSQANSGAILSAIGSDISPNPSSTSTRDDEWPSSTNSIKKEIDPYQSSALNSLLLGASSELKQLDSSGMTTVRHKDLKTNNSPVLVVEKSVKPVKYHLLRAYLKLRHLLRPVDATFVFPTSNQLQPSEMNAILT